METKNYTLGRGKIYFSRFKPGGYVPAGYRYIGNTPQVSLTFEEQELTHVNSDEGIREEDDSVTLEVTRTGALTTDNMATENIALFMLGSESLITQASVASGTETLEGVKAGHSYRLGVTDANPTGYFGIDPTGFEVADGTPTTLVAGTDYTMDYDTGVLTLLPDSLLAVDGADLTVTFAVAGSTRTRVISGDTSIEGSLMYVSKNPKGTNSTILMPWVKIMPAGDLELKSDDWQQLPLNMRILKLATAEAVYRDGLPAYS
jgi:hypothetical protein